MAWRRGARRELVEKDVGRIVHQLTLLATDARPELRFLGPEEGARLDAAVTTTLMALDTVDMDLVQDADLDPKRLAEQLRQAAPDAMAAVIDDRAAILYDVLLLGCCTHLIEHFTHLPEFQIRTAVEIRRRLAVLERRIADPDEGTAKFEADYREATIALHGDVRLHGLGLNPREQTYELSTAYVNLSVRLATTAELESRTAISRSRSAISTQAPF